MKKKMFVVSDIHGHAAILRRALADAGFDSGNEDHLLVCCGDCFDRGYENFEVYEYLTGIKNKILIRGNHEDLLLSALRRGRLGYHDYHNGTDITVEDFFGAGAIGEGGAIRTTPSAERRLKNFIGSMTDYFETENYVFVHGWLPFTGDAAEDVHWRYATSRLWDRGRFTEWMEMYRKGYTLPDKTIVCGHRSAVFASDFDTRRRQDDFSPYFGRGVIAIDTLTAYSHSLSVLVIEDELLTPATAELILEDGAFELVKGGRKTVDVRLFRDAPYPLRRGDTVVFEKESDPRETVRVTVKECRRYGVLLDLIEDFKPRALGYSGEPRHKVISALRKLYKKDEDGDNTLLAIGFSLSDV